MYWIVKSYKGQILKQELGDDISLIDKTEAVSLILRETISGQSFIFDAQTNKLKMLNLNMEKVDKVKDVTLSMKYDMSSGCFIFSPESAALLDDVLLKDQSFFPCFGILEDGDVVINNKRASFGIFTEDSENLIDLKMERQLYHINNAFSDAIFGEGGYKQVSGLESSVIHHEFFSLNSKGKIKVVQELRYHYNLRSLYLDIVLTPDFDCNKAVIQLSTPDDLLTFGTTLSSKVSTHLGTYIYTFVN